MSRILRYNESINRFFKKNSCISKDNLENKEYIEKNINKYDHICSILLLTVLNSHTKKNNLKIHGYYIACGIDIINLIVHLIDDRIYNEGILGKDKLTNICIELILCIYKSLSQNIETIKYITKENTVDIYIYCLNYLNNKLYDIIKIEDLSSNKKMTKNDIITIKSINNENILKLQKMFKLDRYILIKNIESTYGNMCQIALVIGWILGGGDDKMIENLEHLGIHLGIMLKICYDYENIENDINNAIKTTKNIVVNIGINDSFNLFMDSKVKFIEGCLTLGIYTITTKEIIDLIESKIDKCLENSNIDMKSTYSSFS